MPRRKTVTDEEILAAAQSLFLEEGPKASTRTLAKLAGISEAAIFQRFGTKEELFFAAMVPPPAQLRTMFDVQPGEKSIVVNLESISGQIVAYFCKVMPIFLSLIAHPAFDMPTFLRRHRLPAMRIEQEVLAYLNAEVALGRICSGSAQPTADILISRLHHLALSVTISELEAVDIERAIADTIDMLWKGLKTG